MTRSADGTKLCVTTESSINSETDKRLLLIYEFDTVAGPLRRKDLQGTSRTAPTRCGGANNLTNVFLTGDMTISTVTVSSSSSATICRARE